jgi:glucose/arabinose dehydrogenase
MKHWSWKRPVLIAALVLTVGTILAGVGPSARAAAPYATRGDCGGLARTTVEMADGYCLGLVWQRAGGDGPRLPRDLLPLAGGDWLVSDLGSWDNGRGAVWRLSPRTGGGVGWTRLLSRLSLPHTLTRGPDGRIYVAEMGRILTFDPASADPAATIETVIGDLPDNRLHANRHPLSSFIFDGDGALLVNVGAPSDRCLDPAGAPQRDAAGGCSERVTQAMVRRYAYLGAGHWSGDWTVFASGLRNSVALVRHAGGAIFQGENSVDLTTAERPFDEINRLVPGGDYGWPYCTDMATALPGWTAAEARCGRRTPPVSLLPPHAAPLALLYYAGPMFPELRGRLLMSWHGHRRAGGRVVAIETDASGAPLTDRPGRYAVYPGGSRPYPAGGPAPRGRVLTPGWDSRPGRHPRGSPVGLAVAADGSIWMADDRAAAILRIARP